MKTREVYVCSACKGRSPRWQGQCAGCGAWNTLSAHAVARKGAVSGKAAGSGRAVALEGVEVSGLVARDTGFAALDAVLGRGLVPGGAVLLGGEPGIGKSTLLLQLAGAQARLGRRAVYLSGEESLAQLKGRAERLGLLGPTLMALASNELDDALALLDEDPPPDLLVVDSVQTVVSPRAEGGPGSVSQVRSVAAELIERTKRTRTTLFLVGHVTKDGQIAGPKLLEHMVDTVLYLEGDRQHLARLLRVLKNRFGPSDELVVFTMQEQGLCVVDDPSTFFLGARDPSLSGAAVVMALDGQRPLAVEVQALAGRSFLPVPRRTALGLDVNRLHLILAVLEKRLKLNMGQTDVYAKLGGGLILRDPGLDLGLAAAILSSFYDRPLPEAAVFWGEVDLNGQVRPVAGQETRLKQAKRLSYRPMIHSGVCPSLATLQRELFGSKKGGLGS